MAELEKTVASLRKQVKLCAPVFVFCGVTPGAGFSYLLRAASATSVSSRAKSNHPIRGNRYRRGRAGREEMKLSSVSSDLYNCRVKRKFEPQQK